MRYNKSMDNEKQIKFPRLDVIPHPVRRLRALCSNIVHIQPLKLEDDYYDESPLDTPIAPVVSLNERLLTANLSGFGYDTFEQDEERMNDYWRGILRRDGFQQAVTPHNEASSQ